MRRAACSVAVILQGLQASAAFLISSPILFGAAMPSLQWAYEVVLEYQQA